MDKTLNILTIVFQLVTTFILTVAIYMIFAFLDNDFGIDGFVGLVFFQPIAGVGLSILTILACFIAGLPIRLNKAINKWWTNNFHIIIFGIVCGLTFLFLSVLPCFTKSVTTQIGGNEIIKQIPNPFLSISGRILTAFMTLHIFPPNSLKIKTRNFIRTTFILTVIVMICVTFSQCVEANKNDESQSTNQREEPLISRLVQNASNDFFFENTADSKICSQHLHYLGELKNEKGESNFKVMTLLTEWGTNCKVTSRILVYSADEKYLGNYFTHGILPTQLMENGLFIDGMIVGDFSKEIPDSLEVAENIWAKFEK